MSQLIRRNKTFYFKQVRSIQGTKESKTFSLKTEKEKNAKKLQRALDNEIESGVLDVFDNFTLNEWLSKTSGDNSTKVGQPFSEIIQKFLDDSHDKRDVTIANYKSILNTFNSEVGDTILISMITQNDVKDFCFKSELSPASQNNYLRHLKSFFSWVESQGYGSNPATGIKKRPQNESLGKQIISEAELDLMVKKHQGYINSCVDKGSISSVLREQRWFKPVVYISFYAGLRQKEIVNLKWKNVDLEERTITINDAKGGKTRKVVIVGKLFTVLASWFENATYKAPENHVFPSPKSRTNTTIQMMGHTLSKVFREVREDVGLSSSIRFHSLRHSCATFLLNGGLDLAFVQKMLGHQNITITQRYLHLDTHDLKDGMAKIGLM